MKMRLTVVLSFLFCMPGLFVILLSGISLFLPSWELILIAGLVLAPCVAYLDGAMLSEPTDSDEIARRWITRRDRGSCSLGIIEANRLAVPQHDDPRRPNQIRSQVSVQPRRN
jgi:hypothetical protein